jgi:dipeptidyl-peptidase-4
MFSQWIATLLLLLFSPIGLAQAVIQAPTTDSAIRTVNFANSTPTGHPPAGISWSPDGKRITFVAADAAIGQPGDIIQVDSATGHASVLATKAQLGNLSSAAISEKDKDHRNRYNMSSFLWADDGKHLLLDNGGHLWLYNIDSGTGTLIVDTGAGSGDDPKFSPDAKLVSYIRDHNLYVHPVADSPRAGKETPLTRTTSNT